MLGENVIREGFFFLVFVFVFVLSTLLTLASETIAHPLRGDAQDTGGGLGGA